MAYVRSGAMGAIGTGYTGLGAVDTTFEQCGAARGTAYRDAAGRWYCRYPGEGVTWDLRISDVPPGTVPRRPRRPPESGGTTPAHPSDPGTPPPGVVPGTPSGPARPPAARAREPLLPWWVWAMVGLGGAVLLLGGGTAVYRRRKKRGGVLSGAGAAPLAANRRRRRRSRRNPTGGRRRYALPPLRSV
jgi:hypothetical protein